MIQERSILIIGKPGTTKTTFLAQFVTIARKARSAVSFWKTPENIQPIEDAISRLRKAEETQSTPADNNLVMNLPVTINGEKLEIICPDYGGEQINEILNLREVAMHWQDLVIKSNVWILFVRPQLIHTYFDLSNKTVSDTNAEKEDKQIPEFKMSEQASIIELIQFMLHIKKVSSQTPIITPKLTIALTCWDEIKNEFTPDNCLTNSLPLLSQFLKTIWQPETLKIIGVSAQGFELRSQENKDKYLDEGLEKFPFVVKGDSTQRIYDLTQLISEAI